jgi:hypothetical protein
VNERARARLERLGWHAARRYDTAAIAERMRVRGFEIFPAAAAFLERYGALCAVETPIYPRGTDIYFHTDPDSVAIDPSWTEEWEQVTGTRVFPIGATAYDDYILIMDEHGRVFGMDMYLNMTYWADDAEELLDMILGLGGTFRPVDPDDRRPIAREES